MNPWRRIAAFTLAAASLGGAVALFPDFRLEPFDQNVPPVIRVELGDAGAPREFMAAVLVPVVAALGEIEGVQGLEASAAVGTAKIELTFGRAARRDALADVRNRLESLRRELPATLDAPRVARAGAPLLAQVRIRAESASFEEVARWAEEHIADPVRLMPGVAGVSRRNDEVRVVDVLPDSRRLAAPGLTILDVAAALRQASLTTRAGLATVPVRMPAGDSVPLATLAQIQSAPQPPQPPVVELLITAGERAHTLATLARIEGHLEWVRANGVVPATWQVALSSSRASAWRVLTPFIAAAVLAVVLVISGVGVMAGGRAVRGLLGSLLVMLPAGGVLLAAGGYAFSPPTFLGFAAAVVVGGVFAASHCRPRAIIAAMAVIAVPCVLAGWSLPGDYEIFRIFLLSFAGFLLPGLLWQALWYRRGHVVSQPRAAHWLRFMTTIAPPGRAVRVAVVAIGVAGLFAVVLIPWDEPSAQGQERVLRARVYGGDPGQLVQAASDMAARLKEVDGVVAVRHSLESLTLQWHVELAQEKAALLGIAGGDIRRIVNLSLEGAVLGNFVEGSRRWQVRLALPEIERERADAVERLIVAGEVKGRPLVYLREVATAEREWDHAQTQRDLRGEYVDVSAVLASGTPVGASAAAAREIAAADEMPAPVWVGSGASVHAVRVAVAGALAAGLLLAGVAVWFTRHRGELARIATAALVPLPGASVAALAQGSFSAHGASALLLASVLAMAVVVALLAGRARPGARDSGQKNAGLALMPVGLLLFAATLLPVALVPAWRDFLLILSGGAISAMLLWPWVLPPPRSRPEG